jgi:hypothetical protein
MKKLIATLLLLAVSSVALAQGVPTIGLYEDPDYTLCFGDIVQYVSKDVYVAAWLPPEIPVMTACEFAVSGLPGPADAIIAENWTTPLVIGDLGFDISLAWAAAQPGPWVLCGTLDFFALIDLGPDVVMQVVEGGACTCLVVVDGDFVEHDAVGGQYVFNCSDPANCECFPGTATEDTSWGSLKSLY